jgi:hypothetical protein
MGSHHKSPQGFSSWGLFVMRTLFVKLCPFRSQISKTHRVSIRGQRAAKRIASRFVVKDSRHLK